MPKEQKIRRVRNPRAPRIQIFPHRFDVALTSRNVEANGLANRSFVMAIVGRPNSGKTNLMLNLVCVEDQHYHQVFKRIFFVGPSQRTLPVCGIDSLRSDQKFDELSLSTLATITESAKQQKGACLLIMDDVGNDFKDGGARLVRALARLASNRRQICPGGLSIIVTAQVFNMIPLPIRKQVTSVVVCGAPLPKEAESLYNEIVTGVVSREMFDDIIKFVNNDPAKKSWLHIHAGAPKDDMFCKEFSKLRVEEEGSSSDA